MSTNAQGKALPAWYREFLKLFRAGAGHCFILCGDVHGVTSLQGASQLRFMQGILMTQTRDIVVYYHRACGITFPAPSMRRLALDIVGRDWAPRPAESDPFTAALSASGVVASMPQGDVFSRARSPREALLVLEHLLLSPLARGRVAVILDGADLICPASHKAVMREEQLALLAKLLYWGTDSHLVAQNNPVFLLVPRLGDLHADLRDANSGYKVIELSLPDEATRLAYIRWYLEEHRKDEPIPLVDLSKEDLARNTAGLNLRQIEDILLLGAMSEEEQDGHSTPGGVTRLLVKSRKDAIIQQQYHESVVILEPLPGGFASLGGMERLIAWMRAEVMAPLRDGRFREVPKGILLAGPPGNGKTLFVQAAAYELGFNAIALRMSSILGGVVGTSERNLQQTFDLAESLSPTFLFIDEIDQTHLAQRGNQSGSPVAANLFGMLLQFLGNEALRGHIMVVGATNHPELLDAALLRPGRFDIIFPVLCPDEAERRSMLAVQSRLQGTALAPEALSLLALETDKYSAADLEALVKEARLLARQAGRSQILLEDARLALDNIRPITLATVDTFTRHALEVCNNLRFLPPQMAASERERRRIEAMRRAEVEATRDALPVSEARSSRRL
jgi:transitional endoplasmic reticulum ATPase